MHAASGIGTRHTALPLERYRDLGTFRQSNDIFIEVATDLAEALARNGLAFHQAHQLIARFEAAVGLVAEAQIRHARRFVRVRDRVHAPRSVEIGGSHTTGGSGTLAVPALGTFTTVATESGTIAFAWSGDNGFSAAEFATITVE